MTLESIAWRGTHVELPNSRRVVLVYGRQIVGVDGKPIAFAWWDGTAWQDARGELYASAYLSRVAFWAELPTGAD